MPDIYLFEPDAAHQKVIKEIFAEYSIKRNLENELKLFSEIPKNIGSCGAEISVYMIKSHENTANLAASISGLNASNYIILIADGLNDVLSCISPDFRPAGIIIKPAEYATVAKIWDEIYSDMERNSNRAKNQFRFRIRSREYFVAENSILYFEAADKKMLLRTAGQVFEFNMPFDEVQKQLSSGFARIHKSYVVNTAHIKMVDYKNMIVEMDDGSRVYISRTYKNNLAEALNNNERMMKK